MKLRELPGDVWRLLRRSRTFLLAAIGAMVTAWPQIAEVVTSYQPVADVLGHGDQARRTIAVVLFLGVALRRWWDARTGKNPV